MQESNFSPWATTQLWSYKIIMDSSHYRKIFGTLPIFIISLIVSFLSLLFWALFLYANRNYIWVYYVLLPISFCFLLIAIWQLYKKEMGIVRKLLFFLTMLYLYGFANSQIVPMLDKYRSYVGVNESAFENTKTIKKLLNLYIHKKSMFPPVDSWWEDISKNNSDYMIYKVYEYPDVQHAFAFNRNIGEHSKEAVSNTTVVIFESDHPMDQAESTELLNKQHAKDKYFLLKFQRFVYILFADGTIAKYRLRDQSVALYDPNTENYFSDYLKPGTTPYSPLKWK